MFVSLRPAQHLRKLRPMRPNPLIATLIVTAVIALYINLIFTWNMLLMIPKNRT
jgi:hypothetical protein